MKPGIGQRRAGEPEPRGDDGHQGATPGDTAREVAELQALVREMRAALEAGRQQAEERVEAARVAYGDQVRDLQETCRALREALETEREAGRTATAAAHLAFGAERQSLQATIVELRAALDSGR